MAIAGIGRRLDDDVRCHIVAVALAGVEGGDAGVVVVRGGADHTCAVGADGIGSLRALQRGCQKILVFEVFGHPKLCLARPGEAWDVLLVDGHRQVLLPRSDAGLVHGGEAPGLAGQDVNPEIGVVVGAIDLTYPGIVAVALVAVGGASGALQVQLGVARNALGRGDVTLDQHAEAALAGAATELAFMVKRALTLGDAGVEVRRDVIDLVTGAIDAGTLKKAAELHRDAAEMKGALGAGVAGILIAGGEPAGIERGEVSLWRWHRGVSGAKAERQFLALAAARDEDGADRGKRPCLGLCLGLACCAGTRFGSFGSRRADVGVLGRHVASDMGKFGVQCLDLCLDRVNARGCLRHRWGRCHHYAQQGATQAHRTKHNYIL